MSDVASIVAHAVSIRDRLGDVLHADTGDPREIGECKRDLHRPVEPSAGQGEPVDGVTEKALRIVRHAHVASSHGTPEVRVAPDAERCGTGVLTIARRHHAFAYTCARFARITAHELLLRQARHPKADVDPIEQRPG
jgi:hypothetical protein